MATADDKPRPWSDRTCVLACEANELSRRFWVSLVTGEMPPNRGVWPHVCSNTVDRAVLSADERRSHQDGVACTEGTHHGANCGKALSIS